jgi:hypothetical protein
LGVLRLSVRQAAKATAAALLVLVGMTAQAADTTLTLACQGTNNLRIGGRLRGSGCKICLVQSGIQIVKRVRYDRNLAQKKCSSRLGPWASFYLYYRPTRLRVRGYHA